MCTSGTYFGLSYHFVLPFRLHRGINCLHSGLSEAGLTVSVWEGAEAVHLQAEETKREYSRNIVTNSRETPSWREIVNLTALVKLASFT
nr:hypothetical protein [Tanacetum cinerariifolium]